MAVGSLVAVPELQAEGPARLEAQQSGFLTIRFLATGAEMTTEARTVVRYVLLPGTLVHAMVGEDEEVLEIGDAAPVNDRGTNLLRYSLAESDDTIAEDQIILVPEPEDPGTRLRTAAFHELRPRFERAGTPMAPEPWGPLTLCSREALLQWRDQAWKDTGGVVSLAGSRVEPLPHQLLTAQRILRDRHVRFLLADEVGLGKTIEAGLVMQSLLALRPQMRVLVVAPGALISQWFVELYVRFGGRQFLMLDSERLAEYAGNPWDESFVIASSRAIEGLSGRDALRFATTEWDLVIVDECHRMEPDGLLYKRIVQLSKSAKHLLLLSATPERQHPAAYLALLHLLQPEAYPLDDPEGFERKLELADRIGSCIAASQQADAPKAITAAIASWNEVASADSALSELLAGWKKAKVADRESAREAVLTYAREHYVLDHRVIRHRRAVLARLAEATGVGHLHLASRSLAWVDYKLDAKERAALQALADYRQTMLDEHAVGDQLPPRLAHWLLQLQLAAQAHPRLLDRLLAMRAAVLDDPEDFAEYRERAVKGEDLAQVLRGDLSDAERTAHIAISASCHAEPEGELGALEELQHAVGSWAKQNVTARTKALIQALNKFWQEHPQEKVLVFTAHALAVGPIADAIEDAIGGSVLAFGAHQEAAEREEAALKFQNDDDCWVMVSDPLGGEGRNFQFVSVVVHHDLPWSLAAVEQRIGRVDRIGRDGDVPSWVLRGDDKNAIDHAWGAILDQAVAAFTSSTSGLEFVARDLELRALKAALVGGGQALHADTEHLIQLIADERAGVDQAIDECYVDSATAYTAACDAVAAIDHRRPPVGPVVRWLRSMGGGAKHEDDGPKPWLLRPRSSEERTAGTFSRRTALRHPELSFFALGHEVVDAIVDDAACAEWCCANAWRRSPKGGVKKWEGLRVSFELGHDLLPLMQAGLTIEAMRQVLIEAPPLRLTRFIRLDGSLEDDQRVLAVLLPPFDSHNGDTALSPRTSRETWMRPWLGGKAEQVVGWQHGIDRAVDGAHELRDALAGEMRKEAYAAVEPALTAPVAIARSRAALAAAQLGDDHPDSVRLAAEADDTQQVSETLLATVRGAELRISSMAYLVVS